MSQVNLFKNNFQSGSYINTIDTNFTQLIPPTPVTIEDNLPTIDEFFDDYSALFFSIPKTGENSHTTLIESSTEYIGFVPQSLEIDALQQEITFLREQLLQLRTQLNDITSNTSTIANESLAKAQSTETIPEIKIPEPISLPTETSTPTRNGKRPLDRVLGRTSPTRRNNNRNNDRSNDREQFA